MKVFYLWIEKITGQGDAKPYARVHNVVFVSNAVNGDRGDHRNDKIPTNVSGHDQYIASAAYQSQ